MMKLTEKTRKEKINVNQNELYHYGVLGMKWGVRKDRSASGSGNRHISNKTADEKKKNAMKKDVKNRRILSDEVLRKKVERIKMEKQLKELTESEISPGKAFTKRVLSSSGQKVVTAMVTGAALYGVKSAMTKEFNIREAASYMTPKPKIK